MQNWKSLNSEHGRKYGLITDQRIANALVAVITILLLVIFALGSIWVGDQLYQYLIEAGKEQDVILGFLALYVFVIAIILMVSIDPINEISSKIRPITWKVVLPSESKAARIIQRRRVYLIIAKPELVSILEIFSKFY